MAEAGSNLTNEVVVALFRDGEDAHRAIHALMEEGFNAGQIGAVFRSGGSGMARAGGIGTSGTVNESMGESAGSGAGAAEGVDPSVGEMRIRSTISPGVIGSGSGIAGAASDTTAVQPQGLATGSGTITAGASRPGPIPGATVPHYLHREGHGHEEQERPTADEHGRSAAAGNYPATGGLHETARESSSGWLEKLKHIFSSGHRDDSERLVDDSSMNFGTGEGHLGVYTEENTNYGYSGRAFSGSITRMGISQERADRLAGQLAPGGAVVTVSATGRVSEAERIFERNNGDVRYEGAQPLNSEREQRAREENGQVEVFGELRRYYPEYLGRGPAGTTAVEGDAVRRRAS